MYFFKLNIGEFSAWTQGLNSESLGVFLRLLNRYASTEKPIKTQWVSLGFPENEQKKAMDVLSALWDEVDEDGETGWVFLPMKEIIEQYQKSSAKNKANGAKGGRPRKTPDDTENNRVGFSGLSGENPNETQTKPSGFFPETQTKGNSLTHKLINSLNKEVQEKPASRKSDDFRVSVFPKIVSKYNSILGDKLPRVSAQSDKRIEKCRKWANALYREKGCKSQDELLGEAEKFFRQVLRCPFLLGEAGGDRHWRADFDFLMTEKGRIGVVEGKYDGRAQAPASKPNIFTVPSSQRSMQIAQAENYEPDFDLGSFGVAK